MPDDTTRPRLVRGIPDATWRTIRIAAVTHGVGAGTVIAAAIDMFGKVTESTRTEWLKTARREKAK